jgi:hypothetical protein
MPIPKQRADQWEVIGGKAGERTAIDRNFVQHCRSLGVNPVERQNGHPGRKRAFGGARSESLIECANRAAAASPLIQVAHQQHRIGLAPARCRSFAEQGHQPVRL